MKKVEKANIQIRIQIEDFHNAIYGICEKLDLTVGKVFNHDGKFTISFGVPVKVNDSFFIDSDLAHLKKIEIMIDEISEMVTSTSVLVAVYFAEDMSEFSVMQPILNFCCKTNSRLWIYTYPKGDWRSIENDIAL